MSAEQKRLVDNILKIIVAIPLFPIIPAGVIYLIGRKHNVLLFVTVYMEGIVNALIFASLYLTEEMSFMRPLIIPMKLFCVGIALLGQLYLKVFEKVMTKPYKYDKRVIYL